MAGSVAAPDDPADFLTALGAGETRHPGGALMAHLRGTRDLLASWGCPGHLCAAGLFHSVYGTEVFRTAILRPGDRGRVRALIGERAERLVHVYGVMVRGSLYENLLRDDGPYWVAERTTGERIDLSGRAELAELFTLDLANRLEQLPRTRMSLRRMAADRRLYEKAEPLLPPAAVAELRRVYRPRSAARVFADGLVRGSRRVARHLLARRE
jgi:hypothetical protein